MFNAQMLNVNKKNIISNYYDYQRAIFIPKTCDLKR